MDHLLQADPDGLHETTQDHVDRRHRKTERREQQEKNEAEQHSSEIACGSHRLQALLETELLHRGHWSCMWLTSISVWCAYAAGEPTDQLCAWIEKYIPKLDAASKFCHVFWGEV